MVKLIIIKKKKQVHQQKYVQSTGENSGHIPLESNPDIRGWYSRLCGEAVIGQFGAPLIGDGWRVFLFLFSFFCFPWAYVLSVTSGNIEVVSPGD
jgi:hypothetical protein